MKNTCNTERLVPVCVSCKKIRDEKNNWVPADPAVIRVKEERLELTHGICPDCSGKLYPERPHLFSVRPDRANLKNV